MLNWKRIILVAAIIAGALPAAYAHLCDNVFRQADKLIVKPEAYNLVVKDKLAFKVFLQNNMDRGIAEISLVGDSSAFDITASPAKMSIPKDQRAFFEVTLVPKPTTKTGNYPVNFRLVGGGKLFKAFSINAGGQAEAGSAPVSGTNATPAKLPAQPGATEETSRVASPSSTNEPRKPSHVLQVQSVSGMPDIDGMIKDPAWKSAAVLANFTAVGGGQAVYDTTGLLLHDAKNLYMGLYCSDEKVEGLTDKDGIEVQLATNAKGQPAYSFFVSPAGKVTLTQLMPDAKPTVWPASGIRYMVGKDTRNWTVEMVIPFSALNVPGSPPSTWYLRVIRAKASGNAETSFWAPDASGYNSEKGFGTFQLVP